MKQQQVGDLIALAWAAEDAADGARHAETWPRDERVPALRALGAGGASYRMTPGAPVRRRSRMKGREGVFWRPIRRADIRILLTAAHRVELEARQRGKRNGPIGHIGLEVMRELARMVDYKTGQLDPCYDTIAANIRRSRSAVIAAMKRLRSAGFIDWIRRYDETRIPGERGPQVKQTSNAYRFAIPAFLGRLLGVFAHGAPLPEDDEDRRRDHRHMVERWEFEDSPVFGALAKLKAAIDRDERESAAGSESPSNL